MFVKVLHKSTRYKEGKWKTSLSTSDSELNIHGNYSRRTSKWLTHLRIQVYWVASFLAPANPVGMSLWRHTTPRPSPLIPQPRAMTHFSLILFKEQDLHMKQAWAHELNAAVIASLRQKGMTSSDVIQLLLIALLIMVYRDGEDFT